MLASQKGLTLVEMLIVVVVLGLLAVIALPKFRGSTEPAYLATMRGDLRNLAVSQEAYFYDYLTYYGGAIPAPGFTHDPSSGVTLTLTGVSGAGWAATAAHSATVRTCAMFVGGAAPVAPATIEGEVAC